MGRSLGYKVIGNPSLKGLIKQYGSKFLSLVGKEHNAKGIKKASSLLIFSQLIKIATSMIIVYLCPFMEKNSSLNVLVPEAAALPK